MYKNGRGLGHAAHVHRQLQLERTISLLIHSELGQHAIGVLRHPIPAAAITQCCVEGGGGAVLAGLLEDDHDRRQTDDVSDVFAVEGGGEEGGLEGGAEHDEDGDDDGAGEGHVDVFVVETFLEQGGEARLDAHHARDLAEHDGEEVAALGGDKGLGEGVSWIRRDVMRRDVVTL